MQYIPCNSALFAQETRACFWFKKALFFGKKCTITWLILHIFVIYYCIYCKFAIKRKNDAFVVKIVNTRLTKIFRAFFVPDEKLPSSATLPTCEAGNLSTSSPFFSSTTSMAAKSATYSNSLSDLEKPTLKIKCLFSLFWWPCRRPPLLMTKWSTKSKDCGSNS